jgi:hypothetical protein
MQYWQSIRSVGLVVICQTGENPLYKYAARQTHCPVEENDVKKTVLHVYFTLCHLMSKASILRTAPLYLIWEVSFPVLMMKAAIP